MIQIHKIIYGILDIISIKMAWVWHMTPIQYYAHGRCGNARHRLRIMLIYTYLYCTP